MSVLVETLLGDGTAEGRAEHQAPEVDGSTLLSGLGADIGVGEVVEAEVVASEGVDLVAVVVTAALHTAAPTGPAGLLVRT